jgi:hypothetical protein
MLKDLIEYQSIYANQRIINLISLLAFFLFILLLIATSSNRPIIGKQGKKGLTGPNGFQGPLGKPGLIGWYNDVNENQIKITFNDIIGQNGPRGPSGQTGPTGNIGNIGPSGEIGLVGKRGLPGLNGSIGIQGPTGDQGYSPKPYYLNYNCKNPITIPVDSKQYICEATYPILQFIDKQFTRVRCCQGQIINK